MKINIFTCFWFMPYIHINLHNTMNKQMENILSTSDNNNVSITITLTQEQYNTIINTPTPMALIEILKPMFVLEMNGNKFIRNDDISTFKHEYGRVHMDNCGCDFIKFPKYPCYFRIIPFHDNHKQRCEPCCLYVPVENVEESFIKNPLLCDVIKNIDTCMCINQLINGNPNGGIILFGNKRSLKLICAERKKIYNAMKTNNGIKFDDVATSVYCCGNDMESIIKLETKLSKKFGQIKRHYFVNEFYNRANEFNNCEKYAGHVLLLLIQNNNIFELSFAQGKRNFGESWIEAAKRECLEESLICVSKQVCEHSDAIMTRSMGFCVIKLDDVLVVFDKTMIRVGNE